MVRLIEISYLTRLELILSTQTMRKQSETITVNMKIFVKNNDVNKALRILKKKLLAEGSMKEARENAFFRSKGEKETFS